MNSQGRPKSESRSAQHEGSPIDSQGRPKSEFRSAQHGGNPMSLVHPAKTSAASTSRLAGTQTLLYKEVLRFWKVSFQTVAAPVLTAVLYLLIFGHVLSNRVQVFEGVGYTSFLIPGLVMMSVLQNAFANSSSSLVQSKITGNLVFLLVAPLSHWAWFIAYVGAAVVRGLGVGLGVVGASFVVVGGIALHLLRIGYKIRH